MSKLKGLVIIGFGGHARSVADVALAYGIKKLIFVDENGIEDEKFEGHPVLRSLPSTIDINWACIPASGDGLKRQIQVEQIQSQNWPVATLIAPSATIGVGAIISSGSFIGQHTHVGPMTIVGKCCIVNTGAVVEHDCVVGDYSHLSVNSTVAGRAQVGKYVLVGAGATVIDGIKISDNVIIGAGGVVVKSINISGTYVGIPVKLVNESLGIS